MAFVRAKKIKGQQYGYLVSNYWEAGKTKQKVAKYLGKIYSLEKQQDVALPSLPEIYSDALIEAIAWELSRHGFVRTEKQMLKDGIIVDFSNHTVKGKSNAVLKLNEGFLCEHTLKQMVSYTPSSEYPEKEGPRFASMLLEAGISKDAFVELYERVHKLFKDEVNKN